VEILQAARDEIKKPHRYGVSKPPRTDR